MCGGKKKLNIRQHEVAFIGICTKGEDESYKNTANPRPLDALWELAEKDNQLKQLLNAHDDEGDQPLHIACENGHDEVVEWILNKKELRTNVNALNGNALTPLFLTCLKGYMGAEGTASKSEGVKAKRLKIVKMLVKEGASVNFIREVVLLTPLHWAAWNDDAELCRFLLVNGADQTVSAAGSMPVDIAGFSGNLKVIKVF